MSTVDVFVSDIFILIYVSDHHTHTHTVCLLLAACMGYNLLSFPPAINLNKSLQIPRLTLPFCVSACALQSRSMKTKQPTCLFVGTLGARQPSPF